MWRIRVQVLGIICLSLLAGVVAVQSAGQEVQAEPAVTPTLIASNWQYLPSIRGAVPGPTTTATPPPPTRTPPPSLTATATPSPTPTNEPTDTPEPGRLAVPTLYDIMNADGDGSFSVGWSTSPDAEYYQLQQQRNGGTWQQIYEGPLQTISRDGLAPGQYCYRVRGLNAVTDSEWSAPKCTQVQGPSTPTPTPSSKPKPTATPTPKSLSCRFETVGKFLTPGLAHHRMTYLHGPDLIVITGGWFQGFGDCGPSLYCTCTDDGVCYGESSQIYVYDIKNTKLYPAGTLDVDTSSKIALPLGDDGVLLTGTDDEPDLVITIKKVIGGFQSSVNAREPQFAGLITAVTIDRERALLVSGHYNAFIYNMVDSTSSYIGSFGLAGGLREGEGPRPLRMAPGGSKFLFTGYEGYAIIDIVTKAISTYRFPPLTDCDPGWGGECPTPFAMEVSPLDEDHVLLTNGETITFPTSDLNLPTTAAFVVDSSAKVTAVADTIYAAVERVRLVTNDGYVILVNGMAETVLPTFPSSPGAEIYDSRTRRFTAVQQPGKVHAAGNALRLEDGRFLISGGYSDYYGESSPDFGIYGAPLTSGGAENVELVTCR